MEEIWASQDLDALFLSIDFLERNNSELTRSIPKRAPGRSLVYTSRENFMLQASTIHQHCGGFPPFRPVQKGKFDCSRQQLKVSALLPLPALPSPSSSSAEPHSMPPAAIQDAAASVGGDQQLTVSRAVPVPNALVEQQQDRRWIDAQTCVVALRCGTALAEEGHSSSSQAVLRQGLSPMMLERNKHMAAARRSKGKRLTKDELDAELKSFSEWWSEVCDDRVFEDAYTEWRRKGLSETLPIQAYKCSWAHGSLESYVTPKEFHQHWQQSGWPTEPWPPFENKGLMGARFSSIQGP